MYSGSEPKGTGRKARKNGVDGRKTGPSPPASRDVQKRLRPGRATENKTRRETGPRSGRPD